MSQFDFGDLDSPLSGTELIDDNLEPWRDALYSLHSGTSRPAYAVQGLIWRDTTTTPWVIYMFDGADDIALGTVNATTNKFIPSNALPVDADYGDIVISSGSTVYTIDTAAITTSKVADAAITYAKMQNISATKRIWGRKSTGAGSVEECTISDILDFLGTAAAGDIIYRDGSGWQRLPAGTAGKYLQTNGSGGTPPAWNTVNTKLVNYASMTPVTAVTNFTGVTPIPYDNTPPQSNEGVQWGSFTYAPTTTGNLLKIRATVNLGETSNSADNYMAALFKDSDTDCLAATTNMMAYFFNGIGQLVIDFEMLAPSTSGITFKGRCSGDAGSTIVVNGNGNNTSGIFGGKLQSKIEVWEFTP